MTRGVYNTKQKERILAYLIEHQRQRVSADELAARLSLGKTTAYRHLEALVASGEATKYALASGATCYQYVADASQCKRHSHLVCTRCGEMLHVDCDVMQQLQGHMAERHGFALDAEKSMLYGCCARCAGRKEGEKPCRC